MTDLDGKNLIAVGGDITELTYFMNWGFEARIQGQFMWSAQSRISEIENRMPMRSPAKVSNFKLQVSQNASTLATLFAVRKSKIASVGLNSIGDETLDAIQLRPAAGQLGNFESSDIVNYEADDYICFKWREFEPNFTMTFRMQCRIDFEPA